MKLPRNYDGSIEWERVFLGGVLGVAMAFLLLLGAAAALEALQGYRSFDKQADCLVQRMTPVRKTFSTHVACAPSVTRQDTTTIQLEHGR